jgi:hypothetical protein
MTREGTGVHEFLARKSQKSFDEMMLKKQKSVGRTVLTQRLG